jgi:hypothetical protein
VQTEASEREAFLKEPADNFAIYQLRRDQGLADYRFASLAELQHDRLSVDRQNYELVYTAPLTPGQSQEETLDKLYEQFNLNHPADFTGHSLSVSDIVALRQNGEVSCHYVDLWFRGCAVFSQAGKLPQKRGNGDGGRLRFHRRHHQQRSEGSLPSRSWNSRLKSGQPISLIDLAEAAHREEQQEKKKVRAGAAAKAATRSRSRKYQRRKKARKGRFDMNDFTQDELTLMSIYNGSGTRQGLIDEMTAMRAYLDADEAELRTLTDSAIKKLGAITDKEYAALELIPDFEE